MEYTMAFTFLAIVIFTAGFICCVSFTFLYFERKDLKTDLITINDWRKCKGYNKKTWRLFDI